MRESGGDVGYFEEATGDWVKFSIRGDSRWRRWVGGSGSSPVASGAACAAVVPCVVFKSCHSFVHPICNLHFIAHFNMFSLINLSILNLYMTYLILRKRTKSIPHQKGEFLKISVTSKAQKTCILSFIVASRYIQAIKCYRKSGLCIYSLQKNSNAKMIRNLLWKSQICLSPPFAIPW